MSEPWGYHMLLDCKSGNIVNITDKEIIKAFVKELVIAIKMIPYGDIWIERFATHDPDKAGISFCQMIETSNITGHFVEKNGDFYIDVFSCMSFDNHLVSVLVQKYFDPKKMVERVVHRDANF